MTAALAALTIVLRLVLLIVTLTVIVVGAVLAWDITAGPSARLAAARARRREGVHDR